MLKKLIAMTALVGIALGTTGAASAEKVYKLKLGHTGAPNHHYQDICTMFASKVKERTKGGVEIAVFPSDQLGKQVESVEGTMLGTQDMVLTSDTVLSNWVPDMGILNLPFIFSSMEDARTILDGPIGAKLAAMVEPHGAVVIGWWDNGMRHITNNKRPIVTPADLKGIKIRVPEGEVFVETFKSAGSRSNGYFLRRTIFSPAIRNGGRAGEPPGPHPDPEVLRGAEVRIADRTHPSVLAADHEQETAGRHMPKAYRDAILTTGREMGPIHTNMVNELEKKQWDEVAAKGMKINDVDKKPFQQAVMPVYEKFKGKLNGKIIDEIIATLKK